MAQNPIGTIADEERLIPLRWHRDRFVVDVTEPLRRSDLPEEGAFVWRAREEGDVTRLAFGAVDEPDAGDATHVRDLEATDEGLLLDVPEALLADDLDLDVETYDADNPLLFEPAEFDGMAVGGSDGDPAAAVGTAIELVPVRFADGTPFRDEPVEDELDSDPVAEAELEAEGADGTPRPATVSAPIDAPIVAAVLDEIALPEDEVVDVLEAVARRDLVDEADDVTEYDPLVVDDRAVIVVEDAWEAEIAPALDADPAAVTAAREIHDRQAADLLERSEADEYRDIDVGGERHAIVVES